MLNIMHQSQHKNKQLGNWIGVVNKFNQLICVYFYPFLFQLWTIFTIYYWRWTQHLILFCIVFYPINIAKQLRHYFVAHDQLVDEIHCPHQDTQVHGQHLAFIAVLKTVVYSIWHSEGNAGHDFQSQRRNMQTYRQKQQRKEDFRYRLPHRIFEITAS